MKTFLEFVQQDEEVAANAVGTGNVKGIAPGEDPPVKKKDKKSSPILVSREIKGVF